MVSLTLFTKQYISYLIYFLRVAGFTTLYDKVAWVMDNIYERPLYLQNIRIYWYL